MDFYIKHLKSLKKDELIELLLKFTPKGYLKEIELQSSDSENLSQNLKEFRRRLFKLVEDNCIDTDSFFSKLRNVFDEFKSLTKFDLESVFDILEEFAITIEEIVATIYHDEVDCEYYDDDIFGGLEYSEIVSDFFSEVSKERKGEVLLGLLKLERLYVECGLVSWRDYDLTKQEKEVFKKFFKNKIDNFVYLNYFSPVLSVSEKEDIYKEEDMTVSLIELYLENGKEDKAISLIKEELKTELNLEYIENLKKFDALSVEERTEYLQRFLNLDFLDFSSDEFDFISKELLEIEEAELRKKFIVKTKESIEVNTEHTGNEYYIYIQSALKGLKNFEDITPLVKDLKKRFKRRRSFIKFLNKL
jgi:hypothetical protein